MRLALASLMLLAAARCPAAAPAPDAAPGSQAGDNVLIIDFDTLRADGLGCLGQRRPLTPNLDALAARSYLFTDAVSPSAWTLPATMSFFTSLYPHQHTVTNKFSLFTETRKEIARLPARFTTMAEVFKRNGYQTAGFTGDAGVEARFGFGRGFDVYFDSVSFGGFDRSFPMALDWLKTHQDGKYFLFVHGYDVHGQYPEPPDFSSRFAKGYRGPFTGAESEFLDLRMKTIKQEPIDITAADAQFWRDWYDEKILRADERFGRFWREFSALPSAKKTIVIVIADHGEQFYEHGGFDHGMTLYEETIRVPLLLHAPDGAGAKIGAQASLIDVMPTILDWLGLTLPGGVRRQMQGQSLLSAMAGQPRERDAYAETSFLLQSERRMLRTAAGWKLIYDLQTLTPELYDLRRDPGEKVNLAEKEKGRLKDLSDRLFAWMRSPAPIRP